MRKLLLFLLVSIALPALAQNGKKVYADFHGVRYTRQHDGTLGNVCQYGKIKYRKEVAVL
jgi:hypothetical protein